MKALWIIGGILLLLVLLSLVRVGAVLSFGEELRVRLRLGPAKLTLPSPPAQKGQAEAGKEAEKAPKSSRRTARKKRKRKCRPSRRATSWTRSPRSSSR